MFNRDDQDDTDIQELKVTRCTLEEPNKSSSSNKMKALLDKIRNQALRIESLENELKELKKSKIEPAKNSHHDDKKVAELIRQVEHLNFINAELSSRNDFLTNQSNQISPDIGQIKRALFDSKIENATLSVTCEGLSRQLKQAESDRDQFKSFILKTADFARKVATSSKTPSEKSNFMCATTLWVKLAFLMKSAVVRSEDTTKLVDEVGDMIAQNWELILGN